MNKHFIALIKANEVDSDLYYIDDSYRIRSIENQTNVQILEERDLAVTRDKLFDIIEDLKGERKDCIKNTSLEDKIEILETALETIEDILKLYMRGENNDK